MIYNRFQQIIEECTAMNIIGREREQEILEQCLDSKRPEFLVVFGRRRVGKTFLIKEYFN